MSGLYSPRPHKPTAWSPVLHWVSFRRATRLSLEAWPTDVTQSSLLSCCLPSLPRVRLTANRALFSPAAVSELMLGLRVVVHEFAKVAVGGILKGEAGTKGFAKAARHLQTTVEAVAQAVATISDLYSRAARGNLSHQQLVDFLSIQGFGESWRQALADSFVEHAAEIREVISVTILQLPTYQGLDWRLDLQVASRSVRNQSVPTFLLKLSTRPARLSLVNKTATTATRAQQEPSDELYLEARYATLKAVCSQLDLALAEARSSVHGFRVMRLIR